MTGLQTNKNHIRSARKRGCGRLIALFVGLQFVLVNLAFASESFLGHLLDNTRTQFMGFGTLAIGTSDSDVIGYRRDTIQSNTYQRGKVEALIDSALGAQTFITYKDKLDFVTQFVLRERKENGLKESLQYAFFAYHPTPNWTIRAGRNPHDIYFISDVLNVGFSYDWVRPSKGTYNELFLDHYDGVDVTYRFPLGDGVMFARAYYGALDANINVNLSVASDVNFEFEPFYSFKLQYEQNDLRLSFSYQGGEISEPSPILATMRDAWRQVPTSVIGNSQILAETANIEGKGIDVYAGGFSYEPGKWGFQGEFTTTSLKHILGMQVHAGYLGVSRSITPRLKPYLRVSRTYISLSELGFDAEDVRNMPAQYRGLADVYLNTYRAIGSDQWNVSVGARWDFRRNMALKFQWDNFNLRRNGIMFFQGLSADAVNGGDVNLFAVSLDFVF